MSTANKAPYNPNYDPLVHKTPGENQEYAPTYWVDTVGEIAEDDGAVTNDISVDTVVIGSGFTGLSTALFLAREHNIEVVVLEANQLAWGCTSRNGGQGQLATGRLSRQQWMHKWGVEYAKNLHKEICAGFDTFTSLVYDNNIDCNPQGDGHLYMAHSKRTMASLAKGSEVNNTIFGYQTRMLSASEVCEQYVKENEVHGAMFEPVGIGVHPLKLALGYNRLARQHGAKIHTSSPVINWYKKEQLHHLVTPKAVVRAKNVVVATGGYTSTELHPNLSYRYMPILSNSVVTRVLTTEEINACNLKTNLVITDTRILRFYYRLLPDNRLQMGTRSAITGKDANNKKHYDLLVNGLYAKFPALRNIQIDYSWWGWVDVSHDMMPRIIETQSDTSMYYALGYGGNGVSFSAHAGKRIAEKIAGKFDKKLNELPIYSSDLPKHPLTPFRRMGQRLAYRYYYLKDRL